MIGSSGGVLAFLYGADVNGAAVSKTAWALALRKEYIGLQGGFLSHGR